MSVSRLGRISAVPRLLHPQRTLAPLLKQTSFSHTTPTSSSPTLSCQKRFFAQELTHASCPSPNSSAIYNFETLKVEKKNDGVFIVQINRPEKSNAMNPKFWTEIKKCFEDLSVDLECRAIVLSAAGKHFTTGLDLSEVSLFFGLGKDVGRNAFHLNNVIRQFQESFTAIEKCPKPVIAAVHSFCIGGGIDFISACDIRYSSEDATFSIKEIDLGIVADVGTLQRLPKIAGNDSLLRELAYTGRNFNAKEAKEFGLISRVFADKEILLAESVKVATQIAQKSPLAVAGTKLNLNYARDHSVEDGLNYVAAWNMSMLQTLDLKEVFKAKEERRPPRFENLYRNQGQNANPVSV